MVNIFDKVTLYKILDNTIIHLGYDLRNLHINSTNTHSISMSYA